MPLRRAQIGPNPPRAVTLSSGAAKLAMPRLRDVTQWAIDDALTKHKPRWCVVLASNRCQSKFELEALASVLRR